MKTLSSKLAILSLTIILLTTVSCEKWDLFGIKGVGPVVSETLEMAEISGIILEIPATVYITQGDVQSITIEAQENILENIERSNRYGSLKLKYDRNVSECKPIKVYMTIKTLENVHVSGSGDVYSESVFTTDGYLSVSISGSGKVQLDADANEADLSISGSGEIRMTTYSNRIGAKISGSGKIYIDEGEANYVDINISGSGDIYAFNFPVAECYVNTAGSGDSRLNVIDKLSVKIAGSGDVYYKGHPAMSVNIAGSGSVINAN